MNEYEVVSQSQIISSPSKSRKPSSELKDFCLGLCSICLVMYNSLQGIFTTVHDWLCQMAISFVSGQVTKLIIVVTS